MSVEQELNDCRNEVSGLLLEEQLISGSMRTLLAEMLWSFRTYLKDSGECIVCKAKKCK